MSDAGSLLPVRLQALRLEADGIASFEFRSVDGSDLPAFSAGAHIDLHLPDGRVRSYSLVNAQDERHRYVVAVARGASGGASQWLCDELRLETVLSVSAPRNHFALVEDAPHTVLVAGGIGITPLLAMARRLAAIGASWEMHYAAGSVGRAAYADEVRALALAHGARFSLHAPGVEGAGRMNVQAIVAASPRQAHLYCCGPSGMLSAFTQACEGRDPDRVHVEHFQAVQPAALDGGFQVRLQRSGKCVQVPKGSTILDALLREGISVPNSCLSGTCGVCETRVLAGIPDHRDVILTPAERDANTTMMLCCSGSLTPELVLDA